MRACVHWQEAFIPRESNHTVASAVCLTRRRCVLFVPGGVGVGTGAQGFVYWVDAADKQPCLGTAGMVPWQLKAKGKLFHSGLPHQAVNPMEMCMEAVKYMQDRFYQVLHPSTALAASARAPPSLPAQQSQARLVELATANAGGGCGMRLLGTGLPAARGRGQV